MFYSFIFNYFIINIFFSYCCINKFIVVLSNLIVLLFFLSILVISLLFNLPLRTEFSQKLIDCALLVCFFYFVIYNHILFYVLYFLNL